MADVQKIKRLPWNRTILKKTSDLAKTLIDFASQGGAEGGHAYHAMSMHMSMSDGEQEGDNQLREGGGDENN